MVNAFFKQMGKAIFKPQDYYILGKVKLVNSAFYVFILSVVYALVGLIYISSFLHVGRISDWLKFYSPDYSYRSARLSSDETYFNIIDDLGIYFDTTIQRMSDQEVLDFADEYEFEKGVVFTASNCWIYVEGVSPIEIVYSKYRTDPFDKQWVIDNLDAVLGLVGAIIVVLLCIAIMAIYYLTAIVYYIIAIFLTIILRKQCSYTDLFNVCLYAKTLMFIVEMVCLWIPAVNTSGIIFMVISSVVSMVYIVIGIYRMHKYFPKEIRYAR